MDNFELAKKYFFEGVDYLERGLFQEAEDNFLESLRMVPDRPSTLTNLAAAQIKLKKYSEAKQCSERSMELEKNNPETFMNLGLISKEESEYDLALDFFNRAILLNPDQSLAWLNKGAILNQLKRYDEALASHEKAISINPGYAEAWANNGITLYELERYDESLASYEKALSLDGNCHKVWSNQGVVYGNLKQYDKALSAYEKALTINPDYAEAWLNIGVVYGNLKQYDKALSAYEKALTINPDYAEAWSNKGEVYSNLKQYDEALSAYDRALQIKPNLNYILGQLIHNKMMIGDWTGIDVMASNLSNRISSGFKAGTPFSILSILDSPQLHLQASKIWALDKYPLNHSLPALTIKPHKKIRLGYFSADFGNHPVSILTSELFHLHDRENFEVVAISLKNDGKNDLMRKELIQAFDQFIDVENKSDIEIARLCRNIEIDIAIDLGGHTHGSRTGIFSYRASPIQVNYLGYPGTMGAEYIDYIIADPIVIPKLNRSFYREKVVSLPDTYIVDDSRRLVSKKNFSRTEFGLPDSGIVFCVFNNSYKINQDLLKSWSRILLQVPNSVLWISENNQSFKINILNALINLGIRIERVIFAKRLESPQDHLKRYQLADLFLDTSPYGAHTTAIDALRVGLPIVTLLGEAFAGRVAASALNAVGLQCLITNNWNEYESLAIKLATHPKELQDLKAQLYANIKTKPLFNTRLFTKNLEAAYLEMYRRQQAGLSADHIDLGKIKRD